MMMMLLSEVRMRGKKDRTQSTYEDVVCNLFIFGLKVFLVWQGCGTAAFHTPLKSAKLTLTVLHCIVLSPTL